MKKFQCATILALSLMMGACATNISPDSYTVDSVGEVGRTLIGTVISARPVTVEGTNKVGAVTGAVAGGVAGSTIGGNDRSHALGAIGGAIVGALAGSFIEKKVTEQEAVEYIVQTDKGETLTLVQGASPAFVVGQRVRILYGQRSRIISAAE